MSNLYSQTRAQDAVRGLFRVQHNLDLTGNLPSKPAIFPGHDAPVVRLNETGKRSLMIMNWGFVMPQKEKAARRITNARDDKVRTSPFWRGSFEERRCLVPVTSFAEPKGKKPAIWHWFALKGDEPRPLFSFAGLWRPWKGRLKPGGELVDLQVFAILTTSPNEIVAPIHPNRMPVMLAGGAAYDTWLDGTADEAFALAKPFPADDMRIVAHGEKEDAGRTVLA
jgi:putative SOS response-associated peptidase YedK